MSVVIRISEQAYERLQKLAKPFVDTPAAVVDRLLDFYEKRETPNPQPPIPDIERELSSGKTPDLTHTRILNGQVDSRSARKWNIFLQEAVRAALTQGATREELAAFLQNSDLEPRSDSGYRYLPELGMSLQGVSASSAWELSCRLANLYSFPLYVKFEWRMKNGAAHPGRLGELQFTGASGVTFKFVS